MLSRRTLRICLGDEWREQEAPPLDDGWSDSLTVFDRPDDPAWPKVFAIERRTDRFEAQVMIVGP
jgi:hypothetical protein